TSIQKPRIMDNIVGASPCLSRVGFFSNEHGKRPRPRRGGGGDELGGDPCGRPRGLPPPDEGRPQGSPLHSPTSPAPTGTKGLLPKNLPVRASPCGCPGKVHALERLFHSQYPCLS